jgi:hypothetical protein
MGNIKHYMIQAAVTIAVIVVIKKMNPMGINSTLGL